MKLVEFERSDDFGPVYLNPDNVVAVTDLQGRARIFTNGVDGDRPMSYVVTVDVHQAAKMLREAD